MNAPERIFLHGYDFDKNPCDKWDKEPTPKKMFGHQAEYVEYIRADLAKLTLWDIFEIRDIMRELNMSIESEGMSFLEFNSAVARIFNEEKVKK